MAYRTLSIGGATEDLFVCLPHDALAAQANEACFALPLGAKIRVESLVETPGGGAHNTAVGLARLGCDAHFEGILSNDQWGKKLLTNMKKEHVNTDCITIVEGEVSSFSIILTGAGGERVILYEPGTNGHLHDMNFDKELLTTMDWVYLNHIQESSCVIQDDIAEMLAVDGAPKLTWNPGGCQIDMGMAPENNRHLLAHTDLLLLNKEEALEFTGADTPERALHLLCEAGVAIACITDGKRGAMASDGKHLYTCPVVKMATIVDTTGAGDAFGTGMTWALLTGLSLPDALKTGSILAASVVSAIGSQTALLTDTEILQRLRDLTVDCEMHPLP